MMPDEERLRRDKDRTVDQNLRFTTTVTFVVSMVIITATAVSMYGAIDNRLAEAETKIERLIKRQDLYIDRDQAVHDEMDDDRADAHHVIERLREYLAVKFGEILP